jgi:hypothetical protein
MRYFFSEAIFLSYKILVDLYLERANENSPARLRPEQRKGVKDRRSLHTYIADDRRSGIADRRKIPH